MESLLQDTIDKLEKAGKLIRIKEEVDPYLEMAAIQRLAYAKGIAAVYYEKIKGCRYAAVSNLFASLDQSKFIFHKTLPFVQRLIALRSDPSAFFKKPWSSIAALSRGLYALPKKVSTGKIETTFEKIKICDLPQIVCWPHDGGAFITLPEVYTEDPDHPDVQHSNLGMYRIQLSGNDYQENEEVGLHYQIHRGIGIHHSKSASKNEPLKVSIFIGGHPAHILAAVMPLPEGMSELMFAGLLAGRRFRYAYDHDGFAVSMDADFVITGEIYPDKTKPEGPFGDHLGYYSLTHQFPVMKVHSVYARKNGAVWPFTAVGRPPQEDTSFGDLIHEITGTAVKGEIPGVEEVHAVDAAGVHPLLLAVGSERYTPYLAQPEPLELWTQANRILGTGQLSLAKYLFIIAKEKDAPGTHDIPAFFQYLLERLDFERNIHFYTATSIDTLDYSSGTLNEGSKVAFAACGRKKRTLSVEIPSILGLKGFVAKMIMPGILAVQGKKFESYPEEKMYFDSFLSLWADENREGIPLIVFCDDVRFVSRDLSDFLWVTFTRSNPADDIYGFAAHTERKHWHCEPPLLIDARIKPHHAPALVPDPKVDALAEELLKKYGF